VLSRPVALAAIAGAHGVGGEVRLKLFAESVDSLRAHQAFDVGGRTLTLASLRDGSQGPIARFVEIGDRGAAEALRGTLLAVPRSALPPLDEGEYYHADLIGLPGVTPDGTPLGAVVAVENFGAGDIIEIERPDRRRFMVPIHAVTVEADRLIVDPSFVE
jgi:16S rRNA processing protein RimM